MAKTAPHQLAIALDVADLGASLVFYRALGFEQIGSARQGLIFETRTLAAAAWPAMQLRLRAAFGRRPIGSSGGMLALTLRVSPSQLAGIAAALGKTARWVGPGPSAESTSAKVADPDGYVIELCCQA